MSENVLENNSQGRIARPVFLTVLCILTWVGSSLGILLLLFNGGMVYPVWYFAAAIACHVITIYGAFAMWQLKKSGLIIYTIGESVAIFLPYILFYKMFSGFGLGAIVGSMMATVHIGSICMIAFLVMYWINAKHLK